ncbi:A-kinase anchor protein 17A-like protein [Quillaja saponaria]|uniref:A-kinase anchor protein 17A-like protein n=1 Tax=Quillaja saponaria TaxID=32244 RepID=A0AAD7LI26_QUISA|nr:A-kinase anchor protein 17A-like protein [Quillaja saponaria]
MNIRPLEIENGLFLVQRIKLNLTIYPSSLIVTKPIDEWKVKRALIDFLETSLSIPISVPEEDIRIKRLKELKKRKREDPVASGALFIRDLGFLIKKLEKGVEEDDLKRRNC